MGKNSTQEKSTIVNELSQQQQQVITLLLSGQSQAEAANNAGIAPETISRWKHDPVFVAALNAARQAQWENDQEALTNLVSQAVKILGDILQNCADDSIRLRAALGILKSAPPAPTGETDPERLVKIWEIEQREKQVELKRRDGFDRFTFDLF